MIKRHPWLAAFTGLYIAGFAALVLTGDNTEFLIYGGVMLVLIALIMWADVRARFSGPVLWGLSVWGLAHMAGGILRVPQNPGGEDVALYSYWIVPGILKYDKLIHAYGFFVATLAVWGALRRFIDPKTRPTLALFVVVCCAGMGLGAFNEVIEYTATELAPETNVGDYKNNARDLVANMVGALLAVAVIWARAKGMNAERTE